MGARTWTPEQRQKQAEAIRGWKPWKTSTGPKSVEGKAKVARNADTGGKWRKIREALKSLNAALREQRTLIR